ncbi:MAG TPA: hypothetical protein VNN73_03870 [Blastocatellia bacterium]|jgi:hypothetical protein|nr:hypothetical protein [Blastocatellia bacterium]
MQIRIEIIGRDAFWANAFHVEWQYQFADRKLIADGAGHFLVEQEWMNDLEQVAAQTFCRVVRAPDSPQRRRWMSTLIARRD